MPDPMQSYNKTHIAGLPQNVQIYLIADFRTVGRKTQIRSADWSDRRLPAVRRRYPVLEAILFH